jgi:hypothetical protein
MHGWSREKSGFKKEALNSSHQMGYGCNQQSVALSKEICVLQVTPTGEGALWMSARAGPACHLLKIDGKERIVAVGGQVACGKMTIPTDSAVVITLSPPLSSSSSTSERATRRIFWTD